MRVEAAWLLAVVWCIAAPAPAQDRFALRFYGHGVSDIDRVKIRVQGGHGGNGVTAFRREKFVPRGGPSGGEGGRGGDVWIIADSSLNTLLHLRYNPEHIAGRGMHGEGSNRSGRDGEDTVIRVPVGTQIFEAATGQFLQDLATDGAKWLAARGGRGA